MGFKYYNTWSIFGDLIASYLALNEIISTNTEDFVITPFYTILSTLFQKNRLI